MKRKKKIQVALVTLWVAGISLIIGSIHSWHYADFSPSPANFSIDGLVEETQNYGVIHFLTPLCSCSEVIFKHLLKRGSISIDKAKESIVVIDDTNLNYEKRLRSKGLDLSCELAPSISKTSWFGEYCK